MIKLSLCGVLFTVEKAILIRSKYFEDLFADNKINEHDVIELQRSPNIFKHVLSLLIDDRYPFPKKYAYELDYYFIDQPKYCNIIDCGIKCDDYNYCFEHLCKYAGCEKESFLDYNFCKTHMFCENCNQGLRYAYFIKCKKCMGL